MIVCLKLLAQDFLPSGLDLTLRKSRVLSLEKKDTGETLGSVGRAEVVHVRCVLGRCPRGRCTQLPPPPPAAPDTGQGPSEAQLQAERALCNRAASFFVCPLASRPPLVLPAFSPHLCPVSPAHSNVSLPQGGPPWSPSPAAQRVITQGTRWAPRAPDWGLWLEQRPTHGVLSRVLLAGSEKVPRAAQGRSPPFLQASAPVPPWDALCLPVPSTASPP